MSVVEKDWGRQITEADGTVVANIIKRRREYVLDEDFSLEPDTLVGSFFHVFVGDEMIWQGVIVGEPMAGRYLCQIDRLTEGAERVQRLFSLDTLMGYGDEARRLLENSVGEAKAPVIDPHIEWRLYDSEAEAQAAFHRWIVKDIPEPDRSLHDELFGAVSEQEPAEVEPKQTKRAAPRKGAKKRGSN